MKKLKIRNHIWAWPNLILFGCLMEWIDIDARKGRCFGGSDFKIILFPIHRAGWLMRLEGSFDPYKEIPGPASRSLLTVVRSLTPPMKNASNILVRSCWWFEHFSFFFSFFKFFMPFKSIIQIDHSNLCQEYSPNFVRSHISRSIMHAWLLTRLSSTHR